MIFINFLASYFSEPPEFLFFSRIWHCPVLAKIRLNTAQFHDFWRICMKKWKFTFCPSTIPIIWHIVVQTSNFLKIRCKEKWTKSSCYPNAIWASYSVRNILISWEIESYPRKPFEKFKNSQNWMNKTSFSFWDHVNSGLSKTCLKNLCKYEAIQTSHAALRVHMFSILENQSTPINFRKIWY